MGVKLARALQNNQMNYNNIQMKIPYEYRNIAKNEGAKWNFKDKAWELPGEMEFESAKIAIKAICSKIKCKPEEIGVDPSILTMEAETKEQRMKAIISAANVLFTHPEQVICFDTETTGLSKWDEILQMSVYGTDGPIYNGYFKPEKRKTWPKSEAVNHITPAMVENSPTFASEKEKLQEIFDNAKVIIGHNVDFDIKKIKWNGIRIDNAIILDTLEIFKLDREEGKHKLTDAIKYYCPDLYDTFIEGAHDSNTDTWGTMEVFKKQMEQYREKAQNLPLADKDMAQTDEIEEDFDVEFL